MAQEMPQALVVEDEPGLRMIYRHILRKMNCEVHEAADGRVAIALLEAHTPDILFLDIRLPEVDGITVLEYIQSTPRLSKMHIVVVTADPEIEHYTQYRPDITFLLKPVRPEEIRQIAANALF